MQVRHTRPTLVFALAALLFPAALAAQATGTSDLFEPMDVFGLELGADPQISPDGERVVFARTWFDVMTDGRRSNLWILPYAGGEARPLTTGSQNDGSPRWSPSGDRLAYVSTEDGGSEIWVRWMDTGQRARLTSLTEGPGSLAWSPDGRRLAFTMFVPADDPPLPVDMPRPPEGADWGPAWEYIDAMDYRADGAGYLRAGRRHIFVVPAEGGTPRQLTDGPYDHGSPEWLGNDALLFSADRRERPENEIGNSEIYRVDVATGEITQLTDRFGPDGSPAVSPDGRQVAYIGRDEEFLGYQQSRLHVMDADGSNVRVLTADLDRSVGSPTWSADGRRIYVSTTWHGNGRVLAVDARSGETAEIVDRVGGMSFGRPYGGGSYSVSDNDRLAFTQSSPARPAEVAVAAARRPGEARRLTDLNGDLLGHKALGAVEEIWYESSYDGRRIQAWIMTPPNFDPSREYPLVLEIHGGPFADYGPRFAAELQLYAAAGYVVLYVNPRGSSSYGAEFGNLIHHNYPSEDYDDLMSGVDAVLERGYVDPDQLYVTGGSGGGVLSAWIVGKTDRFRAAVVQKPVINWYSFVLYADGPAFFYRFWFPAKPWEDPEHYMARSPISLVGNVTTPTMLLTGERDHRTPIPESEQYYAALKIQGVPAALVRVPDASHGIASRPSNLIAKTAYILGWFERWREEDGRQVSAR